jgi:predicted dehydrogenase
MIRREFIKTSALATGSLVAPITLSAKDEQIKLGIVGTGWWGTDMLLTNVLASKRFEVVGLCDINELALNKAAELVVEAGEKKPQLVSSYKKLYEMSGLQAVVIATPTHWHALQFIDACDKGLHVFLEKPISYDVYEGKAMMEAHRKANNVVQVDFPRLMVDTNDQVKAYIDSGEAGEIMQVQANINTGGVGKVVEKEIPSTYDYDAFCGPAPKVKFRCSPNGNKPQWRFQNNFNRGILFDWGIHYIHNVRQILDLELPDHVTAIGGITQNTIAENPDHLDVRFDFGGLPVYWSHKEWGFTNPTPDHNIGVYYYGKKATIFAGDLGWEVFPKGGGKKIAHGEVAFKPGAPGNTEIYMKMIIDLFTEFADGIRTNSNENITNKLEEAQKTTATVTYGDIAYLSKSEVSIDQSSFGITDNEEAQQLLFRDYRKPYQHPYKG